MIKIYIQPLPENLNYYYFCPRTYKDTLISGFQKLYELNRIDLVDKPDKDTYIIYGFVPHDGNIKYNNDHLYKLINDHPNHVVIVDNSDEQDKFYCNPPDSFLYFKRSIYSPYKYSGVNPHKQLKENLPANVRPWNYCITDGMLMFDGVVKQSDRPIDISVLLRQEDENRSYILQFANQLKQQNFNLKMVIGEVSKNSRSIKDKTYYCQEYLATLQQSRINIVCNPRLWCDSSRFWESIGQGAVTFCDEPVCDIEPSFINFTHYVSYNLGDLNMLAYNINRILSSPSEAEKIATNGHLLGKNYHRDMSRCQYIVDCIKQKEHPSKELVKW